MSFFALKIRDKEFSHVIFLHDHFYMIICYGRFQLTELLSIHGRHLQDSTSKLSEYFKGRTACCFPGLACSGSAREGGSTPSHLCRVRE